MPANATPPYVSPAYHPPDYLISSTGLSREELIRQFDGFCQCFREPECSPALVFERLIGNLREAVNKALTDERAQHAEIEEAWHREKIALQSKLDQTTEAAKAVENVGLSSLVQLPVQISPASTNTQIYLQFWFTRSTRVDSGDSDDSDDRHQTIAFTSIRAATTSTPVPYSLAAGCPDTDHLLGSSNRGSYDTRMDPLITTTTVPTTLTQVVTFETPFSNPPQVLVWLTGLSSMTGAPVCIKAVANNITETEFTLHINSGEDTRLGSVGVAWAVWPEARPSQSRNGFGGNKLGPVQVGSVSTVTPGGERVRVMSKSGSGGGTIRIAGLNAVDLVLAGGLWVELVIEGSGWSMRAGPADALVYSARVAYASQ